MEILCKRHLRKDGGCSKVPQTDGCRSAAPLRAGHHRIIRRQSKAAHLAQEKTGEQLVNASSQDNKLKQKKKKQNKQSTRYLTRSVWPKNARWVLLATSMATSMR
jgi:hypothetical protein